MDDIWMEGGLIAKEQREKKKEEKRDGALKASPVYSSVCHRLVGVAELRRPLVDELQPLIGGFAERRRCHTLH